MVCVHNIYNDFVVSLLLLLVAVFIANIPKYYFMEVKDEEMCLVRGCSATRY